MAKLYDFAVSDHPRAINSAGWIAGSIWVNDVQHAALLVWND